MSGNSPPLSSQRDALTGKQRVVFVESSTSAAECDTTAKAIAAWSVLLPTPASPVPAIESPTTKVKLGRPRLHENQAARQQAYRERQKAIEAAPNTKVCTKCGGSRPLTEFNKLTISPTGLAYWCKTCFSTNAECRQYSQNRTRSASAIFRDRVLATARVRSWRELKKQNICTRCGINQRLPYARHCQTCSHETYITRQYPNDPSRARVAGFKFTMRPPRMTINLVDTSTRWCRYCCKFKLLADFPIKNRFHRWRRHQCAECVRDSSKNR